MKLSRFLPAVVRTRPEVTLRFTYRTLADVLPEQPERIVAEAARAAGVDQLRVVDGRWELTLGWRTLVYGLIRRDVEEVASLTIQRCPPGWELVLECVPLQTHSAHAAGVGGVLALAATVWLAAGWSAGVLPGLTTVVAGGLWVDATRVMAFSALERRLRDLVRGVGSALWPAAPAEILPPPPSFSPR